MLRIGVISDSHGSFQNVGRARSLLGRIDWLLHAGDHRRDAERIAASLGVDAARVRAVTGNCDHPDVGPEELLVEIGGVRIYMAHGHRHGVKGGLQRIYYRGQEAGARVVIFGHSHIPVLADLDGLLLFNPGSISEPRRPADPPSCGLLTISDGQVAAEHLFFR